MKSKFSSLAALSLFAATANAQTLVSIYQATLMEPDQLTREISTAEMQRILLEKDATVFDARPYKEFAISHIPGVVHVGSKPGSTPDQYTSNAEEIAAVLEGDKAASIVVYCSGPFCGRSKRAARDLLEAGFSDVLRYQLGMPVWRALGGVTQIELDGIKMIYGIDQTAVFVDGRDPGTYQAGTIENAVNVADSDEAIRQAEKDGLLPAEDHNTRIVVFAAGGEQARSVAEALTRRAFHNVAFYDGDYATLRAELD